MVRHYAFKPKASIRPHLLKTLSWRAFWTSVHVDLYTNTLLVFSVRALIEGQGIFHFFQQVGPWVHCFNSNLHWFLELKFQPIWDCGITLSSHSLLLVFQEGQMLDGMTPHNCLQSTRSPLRIRK